jgi:hypothetical protein
MATAFSLEITDPLSTNPTTVEFPELDFDVTNATSPAGGNPETFEGAVGDIREMVGCGMDDGVTSLLTPNEKNEAIRSNTLESPLRVSELVLRLTIPLSTPPTR